MRVLFLVLFLSITYFSFAQVKGGEVTPALDSLAEPRIMIIPFNPDFYFSDADQQLAEYNKKNAAQIKSAFRYGLTFNLNTRILNTTDYTTENLLNNKDAAEDLDQIYKGLSYKYVDPPTLIIKEGDAPKEEATLTSKFKRFVNVEDEKNAGDEFTNMGELKPAAHEDQYLSVFIQDPAMLTYLQEKYGTDIFVFINQFEVKTHYAHCLDRNTNNFSREIMVHFSIFDAGGKQLYGNAVSIFTDSNTRKMEELLKEYLSKITIYISEQLPPERKITRTIVSE